MPANKRSVVWAVSGLIFSLAQVACSDLRESAYPSLADAKRAGAMTHGWLLEFLPASSRDIQEIHSIDTSQTWCAFGFSPQDAQLLQANLAVIGPTAVAAVHVRTVGVAWWPRVLQWQIGPRCDRASRLPDVQEEFTVLCDRLEGRPWVLLSKQQRLTQGPSPGGRAGARSPGTPVTCRCRHRRALLRWRAVDRLDSAAARRPHAVSVIEQ